MNNRIIQLFQIKHPIIQAGMVWCSGWELASAVSNSGALGLIGSGSMYPEVLKEHIQKCKKATRQPFGVNVPLLYPDIDKHMKIIMEEGVKIVFTSAGNPKTWTSILQKQGITVIHVVSSAKFAKKSEDAGVDAIVGEGFEAGGHNGREETTTMCLIPMIKEVVTIPVIAAGGIASGKSMLAAFALGAEGVQIGTRFVASDEASAHINFKNKVVEIGEGDTMLSMKQLTPVRLIKNKFYRDIENAEHNCASSEELLSILGKARAKKGMFEGDMEEGELEIGEISGTVHAIKPAKDIVEEIWQEFVEQKQRLGDLQL